MTSFFTIGGGSVLTAVKPEGLFTAANPLLTAVKPDEDTGRGCGVGGIDGIIAGCCGGGGALYIEAFGAIEA